ncbi:MAG: hypothetical protein KBT03_00845 [Bacteroidales bacterium]|nr:hypothetical protein [Candidatus Scybalousia scybalohippi]
MAWSEAKWVVDQLMGKLGVMPNNMRAFSAYATSKSSIGLKFLEPADSYDAAGNLVCSVGGVMIRMSTEGFPTTAAEGDLVIDNNELGKYQSEPFVVSGLKAGTTYYFSAFPYSTSGVFNLSADPANRSEAIPADGETVKVTINIDDTTGFNLAVITCVDETDTSATQTATLTKTNRTATFTVPIGHKYHVEYGAVDGYSKPANTASKTSVAGTTTEYSGSYFYWSATIKVTYPVGSTLTCSLGETVYTASTDTGSYTFTVHQAGTWTVKIEKDGETAQTTVKITSDGEEKTVSLAFVKIYGISRSVGASSTAWARTDDAVGKTASASVGTTAGKSDFDDCYPWSEMKRETIGTDVMVKIPEFYFRRYVQGSVEYIKIADKAAEGFVKHPGSGKYIGAYKTSSNNKSVKGAAPTVSQTRATMRTNAKAKGTGWSLIDKAAESAIQMLYLVEFADNNAQAKVGRGYCDANSAAISTGSCDSVPNLTGRPAGTVGKTDVVYRGIEGFWGNIWEWVDGLNFNNGEYWVCTDPAKYADDTSSNYTKLSYTGATNWSGSYITTEGMDNSVPWAMMPSAAGSGSETTGYADGIWSSTGWRVLRRGGYWYHASICGVFTAGVYNASSDTHTSIGSRLLFTPS